MFYTRIGELGAEISLKLQSPISGYTKLGHGRVKRILPIDEKFFTDARFPRRRGGETAKKFAALTWQGRQWSRKKRGQRPILAYEFLEHLSPLFAALIRLREERPF